MTQQTNIHQGGPVYHTGTALDAARTVVILLHGRGASAQDILSLVPHLPQDGIAYLAPQAQGSTWYPNSFLAPKAQNEPYLASALATVHGLVQALVEQGFDQARIVIGGFSQGACLASDYVASRPMRYGGLIAFSGGLIGPIDEPLEYSGDLAGTPAFIGCSDVDPHIPLQRVEDTARILTDLGGVVTKRIYPGMGHMVNEEELALASSLLAHTATEQPAEQPADQPEDRNEDDD